VYQQLPPTDGDIVKVQRNWDVCSFVGRIEI